MTVPHVDCRGQRSDQLVADNPELKLPIGLIKVNYAICTLGVYSMADKYNQLFKVASANHTLNM